MWKTQIKERGYDSLLSFVFRAISVVFPFFFSVVPRQANWKVCTSGWIASTNAACPTTWNAFLRTGTSAPRFDLRKCKPVVLLTLESSAKLLLILSLELGFMERNLSIFSSAYPCASSYVYFRTLTLIVVLLALFLPTFLLFMPNNNSLPRRQNTRR